MVTYNEAGIDVDGMVEQIQIAGILFAAYLGGYVVIRKNVLLVFSFIFGTWFFLAFSDLLVRGAPMLDDWQFVNYRVLMAGLVYMLLGYSFVGSEREQNAGNRRRV